MARNVAGGRGRTSLRQLLKPVRAYATRPNLTPTRTGYQPAREANPGRVPRKPVQHAPMRRKRVL